MTPRQVATARRLLRERIAELQRLANNKSAAGAGWRAARRREALALQALLDETLTLAMRKAGAS